MNLSSKILFLSLLFLYGCMPTPRLAPQTTSTYKNEDAKIRIAFGSCANEEEPLPIWESIVHANPDYFLFIGDNIYADIPKIPESKEDISDAYKKLASNSGWKKLKAHCPVFPIWDDHDYGKNDAGKEWLLKNESQEIFCDFYEFSATDPRRLRDGIYHSHLIKFQNNTIQIILLDTRFFRSQLNELGRAPYVPLQEESATMLGDAQWTWLKNELQKEANIRIICSSIQVVSEEHVWEGWKNMPNERSRLFNLIDQTNANGVIFVSGDRHLVELSCETINGPYPIWDFTSSGFNWGSDSVEELNKWRTSPVLREPNFGLITIDFGQYTKEIQLSAHGENGQLLFEQAIDISTLKKSNINIQMAP